MNRLLMSLLAAAGVALSGAAGAANTTMSKDQYNAEKDRIKATYKADDERCKSLKSNAKDVCEAEVKGKRDIALADAEAAYKNTPAKRYDTYEYTASGNPLELRAPDQAGDYEVRYLSGQEYLTLASSKITVTAANASLKAPARTPVGNGRSAVVARMSRLIQLRPRSTLRIRANSAWWFSQTTPT